ncbi:tyrosine-type recombinase/integrase [Corynebacterium striatum]|uniref:Tyrosine-type recombinase/integrase n=2 Tax=Corynebacterium TaxID=1716 RepID=A0ABX7DDL8_CORST|nr:tyrosine-type recombinase/integrase [Corynebacterium striatum]QQU76443.1 tyrosine-type recombinase/integrase [Corynebacterium striatum]
MTVSHQSLSKRGYSSRDLLDSFRTELQAAGRAPGTISLRVSHVRRMIETVGKPVDEVERGDLVEWLAAGQWAGDARASARASLRVFFKWCELNGYAANVAAELPTVRRPRSVPKPIPDALIVESMQRSYIDPRARLAIEIMATCGLRRDECCRVHSRDVEPVGRGWQLRVVGKGGHVRVVPCPPLLAQRIRAANGYLFVGDVDGHISAGWLGKLVSRVLPVGFTPHKLRHRFGTVVNDETRDIRAVQELLGHASLATTQVYVATNAERQRIAARTAWNIAS